MTNNISVQSSSINPLKRHYITHTLISSTLLHLAHTGISLKTFRRDINRAVAFAPLTHSHFLFLIVVKYAKMSRLDKCIIAPWNYVEK
jgi:hypothetical protein